MRTSPVAQSDIDMSAPPQTQEMESSARQERAQVGRPHIPDLTSLIPPSSAIIHDALLSAPTPHLETPPGATSSTRDPIRSAAQVLQTEDDDSHSDDERVKMASLTLQASGVGWAQLPKGHVGNLGVDTTFDPVRGCSSTIADPCVEEASVGRSSRSCSADDSINHSGTLSSGSRFSHLLSNEDHSPSLNSKRKIEESDSEMDAIDTIRGPSEKIRCTKDLDTSRRPRSGSLHALQVEGLGTNTPRSGRFADSSPASALRHVSEVPAEGAGLRGSDAHVPAVATDNNETHMADSHPVDGMLASAPAGWKIGDASSFAPPSAKRLCIRHQRMADEGVTARLQKSIDSLPLADQTAVNTVWSLFSSSPHPRRALMLQGLLTMCCFSQLSLLSSELALAIRIDPFSLFPREVSLKVLRHLDAISLGRAAQVSRSWRSLADDDLLWRNMCEQHIERKCEKCGWGLPLLNEKRRKARQQLAPTEASRTSLSPAPSTTSPLGAAHGATASASGSLKRSITAAANAAAQERHAKSTSASRSSSPSSSPQAAVAAAGTAGAVAPKAHQSVTRPWKSVYCERLVIERNWRRGRYTTKVLSGHSDGIMCLQYSESLAHPAFPVVVTGSYDRTARIWNMETGQELRVLRGHTRGVRCLQFDEAKLITGSMDRTLKIWNWRTGDLMRTLEGHTEGIVCLHFNEDTLASGSADSNIKIWNFRSGECFTLRGHTDWVNAVQLWTGKRSSAAQAQATRTDWKSGKVEAVPHDQDPLASREGKDGSEGQPPSFLFSASDDGTIRLWDLEQRECLLSYDGHVGQVQSIKLVMLDDEAVRKLAQSAGGGPGAEDADAMRRREMRMQRNESQQTQQTGARESRAAEEERGEGEASTCGYNPPAVPGGRAANTGSAPAIPDHLAYAAAATSSSSGRRRESTLDASSFAPRRKIDPALLHLQERLCKAGLVAPLPIDAELSDLEGPLAHGYVPSSSGKSSPHHPAPRPVLISGSLDNTIRLWCVRTGRCIRTLFGHTEGIWSLSLDKLRIASASHDRCIKTWDTDTGACKQTLVGHRGAVTCVQLGDDKIVSGSDDGDCRIWSFAPRSEST